MLFSNAGNSGELAKIVDYPSAVVELTLKIHVLGAFHVLKHATPHLNDGGSVIITSTVVGLIGFGDLSAYVAAKHGQVGLMRSAAKELAERRIRVNTLHPGRPSGDRSDRDATTRPAWSSGLLFEGGVDLVVGGRGDAQLLGDPAEGQVGPDGMPVQLVEGVAVATLDIGQTGFRGYGDDVLL